MAEDMAMKNRVGGGDTTPSDKVRDSNIELFRIITMLLIVAHHYVVNSGLMEVGGSIYADPMSWRSIFLLIFGAWGKIGINCFVLITGYFMCKSQITTRKFAKLFFEVMFYRILISTVFWVTGYKEFSFIGLLKTLIPVTSVSTGFTNAFLLFYLIIPFLNILVQHLNEKEHLLLLLWCGLSYVLLGTIPGFSITMNYISWFNVLFIISSYIRLYPKKSFESTKLWRWLTIICLALSVLSIICCTWLGEKMNRLMAYRFVTDSNTFCAVATGACAFMLFKNIKVGRSKFINAVASSTFGVLLIHAGGDTMRQWLWRDTLDVVGHYNAPFMPLYSICSVLGVFIICTLIDQLRIRLVEKPFFKLWDKYWGGIMKKYKPFKSKIFSRIGVQEQ